MAYGFPESTEQKQPIPSFKTVDKKVSWGMNMFGLGFWTWPFMKRVRGPKWDGVIDPQANEGSPPNLNSDIICLNQNTDMFKIKFNTSFYFTKQMYANGAMIKTEHGLFEYDPGTAWNFMTWDESDIANAKANNHEYKYIIDKIVENGE